MENRFSGKTIKDNKFLNALAEAYRLQEAILNATELSIISTTTDGIISCFNRAAENMFGYQAEELIGKSNLLIFHDLEEVVKRAEELSKQLGCPVEPVFDVFIQEARNQKTPVRGEWTMQRKDGTKFPAKLSITSLRDEHETLIGYVAIPTELSEQKKGDKASVISDQKFRLLAENIPGIIYLCHNDSNYSMIYLNDHVEYVTGHTAHDFISGKISFAKLIHPDDTEMVFKTVDTALKENRSFRLRYRIRHRSGEWRWIDEVGAGIYVDSKLMMIEGFITDVTGQKLVEEKQRRIGDENLHVFNNPVNLNAIAGFDGYFKRLSTSWSHLLGWTEEELLSKPFVEFIHPDDIEPTLAAVKFIGSGHNLHTFENRYRCKNGEYRWLLWGSASDTRNKLIYASAIDITDRKKSEDELAQSKSNFEAMAAKLQEQNKQLDEFAHIISHNLRSPVGNIQALINLLHDNSSISEYKLILEKLKNVAKNLAETMNDLMDTLKVKTNVDVERIDIRFKEILDKVVQSLEGELILAEASVTYNFNQAPSVYYPKAYLESIFQNLLSNAIKYRSYDRNTVVHFESAMHEDRVELRVTDNGQGIDMEKFGDKLFGLHKTFHSHQEARGVGLFLIKTQVEAMGGSITAQSTVDKGTTFIIRF